MRKLLYILFFILLGCGDDGLILDPDPVFLNHLTNGTHKDWDLVKREINGFEDWTFYWNYLRRYETYPDNRYGVFANPYQGQPILFGGQWQLLGKSRIIHSHTEFGIISKEVGHILELTPTKFVYTYEDDFGNTITEHYQAR